MLPIWKSRKFWLLILDVVISLALYFVPKYVPGQAEDIKFVIAAIQPVFVTLIAAIASEDNSIRANSSIMPEE